jgi:hypothetical protein
VAGHETAAISRGVRSDLPWGARHPAATVGRISAAPPSVGSLRSFSSTVAGGRES